MPALSDPTEPDPASAKSRRRLLAGRFMGFSGLQLLSGLAPLALLPVLARAAGVEGWASLAAGQSVGALVAAFALYGWAIQGPAFIAPSPEDVRARIYRSSMVSRGALLAVTLPLGGVAAAMLAADGFVALTVLTSCAQAVTALSPMWYAIGIGKPSTILAYDTVPRILGVLGSAVAIALGAPLVVYPLTLIVTSLGGITAFGLSLSHASGPGIPLRAALRDLVTVLRTQAPAAATQVAGASYGSATVAVVGIFASTIATAEFAAGDRFYRFTLMAVVAAGNTFQGWVAEKPYPASRQRMRIALTGLTSLGLAGAVAIATLGPWATGVLFGQDLVIGRATAVWFAVAFFSICVSSSLGRHILIPLGRASQLLVATVAGAAVGLPSMAILAQTHGAAGGAAGYAISELAGTVVLAAVLVIWPPGRAPLGQTGGSSGKE